MEMHWRFALPVQLYNYNDSIFDNQVSSSEDSDSLQSYAHGSVDGQHALQTSSVRAGLSLSFPSCVADSALRHSGRTRRSHAVAVPRRS